MTATTAAPLLEVSALDVSYPAKGFRAPPFRALRDVSIRIERGETLGLVGESGSGKSTLGKAILGLTPVASGTVRFDGRDITHLKGRARRALSRDIQVVFQDPYSSLNPAMTVEAILAEPLRAAGASGPDASKRIRALLDQVNMPAGSSARYPGEFSGGQRQRVAIARALALEPKLIVCDEPVSALDLSTQARVLDLFVDLQRQTGVAYLFVTHDLGVVRYVSHRVAVMYGGEIVESGDADRVTSTPAEPYTRKLLLASPVPDPVEQAERRRQYATLAGRAGP
ncbi:ABC transporter ATP-binding protein [Nakamurella flavida]|uniref:ABC transporter ATP-binding protein n=1 Tax=Nakamurella flavida TaxID=363630 RepID=A0A939C6J5_9ACTN|nr:ABC transporter ATP-binding protein [Nakamurella flavida]MBM9478154.1 ABC transporter ATP-binding protein [Nakamurella flavida]MDP9778624.1 peptide/nickel transport system ATP-binding protein [Nakamurella flavida]